MVSWVSTGLSQWQTLSHGHTDTVIQSQSQTRSNKMTVTLDGLGDMGVVVDMGGLVDLSGLDALDDLGGLSGQSGLLDLGGLSYLSGLGDLGILHGLVDLRGIGVLGGLLKFVRTDYIFCKCC